MIALARLYDMSMSSKWRQEGRQEERKQSAAVVKSFRKGKSPETISMEMSLPLNEVKSILHDFDED